ncbi:MAG TPA: hypothetical protein PKA37_01455 [Planctomycetota bacterium]|nr:hypothetical protein [Planctomycetota bacterium]
MNRDYVRYALIPGALLALVTAYRCHLERTDPANTLTHLLSVNVPTLALLLALPFVLRTRSMGHYMGVMAALLILIRIPVGLAYGLSWANKWVVEGTTTPVRYITDFKKEDGTLPEMNPWMVGAVTTFGVVVVGLVLAFAVGYILRRTQKS